MRWTNSKLLTPKFLRVPYIKNYQNPFTDGINTSPAGAVAKYCDEYVCVCVCVSVCLSTRISPEPNARFLPFLRHVARSSSGVVAIRYVLPVLWMCFSTMGRMAKSDIYDCIVQKEWCIETLCRLINVLLHRICANKIRVK